MDLKFHFLNGGKFISRGRGRHPERVISSAELIFVISGRLGIYEETHPFDLGPGDFLLLFPGRKHGGTAPYPGNLCFFWGHFSGDMQQLKLLPQTGHAVRAEAYSAEYERLLADAETGADAVTLDLRLALLLHALEIMPETNEPVTIAPTAERAMQFLQLHFTEKISIAAAADEQGCNADYLGRIFRIRFGCTFTEMLNRIRMKKAAALLTGAPLSIKEIIPECGFHDPAYFRRCFFRIYAMPPAQYRKLHSAIHVNTE